MGWVLVTGGVAADIGKGSCAAVLARWWARSAGPVDYRKVEPCLQGDLKGFSNAHFGDVIETDDGLAFDADVGRAAFLVPGFRPAPEADTSLAGLLRRGLAGLDGIDASPRLLPTLASAFSWPEAPRRVVEVGGTAGEPEHRLVLGAMLLAFGPPAAHLHVTCGVSLPGGRSSTKPAQAGLSALHMVPDAVLLRGADATTLQRTCCVPVIGVAEAAWPAAAWWVALQVLPGSVQSRLGLVTGPDPALELTGGAPVPVGLLTDGAGHSGYTMLRERLLGWSRGRVRLVSPGESGATLVRIGEVSPPPADRAVGLSIVPLEVGRAPRDPAARPDWHGTLDDPAGAVADLLRTLGLLDSPAAESTQPSAPALAYTEPGWAARYLAASQSGALRDHRVLNAVMLRALPGPEGLKGHRVVDLGCGDGRFAALLVPHGAEVVGVEASQPMAAAARRRSLPGFQLIEGSLDTASLPGPFDTAVAPCSLDHVEDLGGALRNAAGALRPGGRLVLSTEHPLRTATPPGARWTEDGAARVRDYDRTGPRAYRWFGRPEPVTVLHRSFGDWVTAIDLAGLVLRKVVEPTEAADCGVPRFWLVVAEKPGPTLPIITIDGTAGAGKSTLGRAVADVLGWTFLDTGARARELATRTQMDMPGSPLSDRCGHPDVDATIQAELGVAQRTAAVLVGRGLGRSIAAGLRVWLDAPLGLRARRRGVTPAQLGARDEQDRARGRLLAPDLLALELDGETPAKMLVAQVLDAWERQVARAAR